MRRTLFVWVMVLLLCAAAMPAFAQTPAPAVCPATVVATPQAEGLPVLQTPGWGSTFTGLYLLNDARLDVTGLNYQPETGQIWMFFEWGTVQAWSGSAAYVALDDLACAAMLPLSIGVYVAYGRDPDRSWLGVTPAALAQPAPAPAETAAPYGRD